MYVTIMADEMKSPVQARLDGLLQKRKELDKKILEERRKEQRMERNKRTLRLIAMGLLMQEEISRGVVREEEVKRKLDGLLKQNSHRAAWDLPLLPAKPAASKKAKIKTVKAESGTSAEAPSPKSHPVSESSKKAETFKRLPEADTRKLRNEFLTS